MAAILLSKLLFSPLDVSTGSDEPVTQIFDAKRFLVEENGQMRPMTMEEVIGQLGEPEETEEWNFSQGGVDYPVVSLHYDDGKYSYNFYNDALTRIQVWIPAEFKSKRTIPEIYNLEGGDVVADTPAAYRVEDCGVHDLWCTLGSVDGTIEFAYISYTNFFDNPYDPVMSGEGKRPPDLQVLDMQAVTDGYLAYATGHVVNNSSKTYAYVQIEIGLYNGDMLVGSTMDNVNNLAPQGIWEFKAPIFETNAKQIKVEEVTGW